MCVRVVKVWCVCIVYKRMVCVHCNVVVNESEHTRVVLIIVYECACLCVRCVSIMLINESPRVESKCKSAVSSVRRRVLYRCRPRSSRLVRP